MVINFYIILIFGYQQFFKLIKSVFVFPDIFKMTDFRSIRFLNYKCINASS